jgi:NTE family protein
VTLFDEVPRETDEFATNPVRFLPTDSRDEPDDGVALCLSGGGFRAMLFHLGGLWRLDQAGILPTLSRVSSVSGGSIAAALLGLRWGEDFQTRVLEPLREFASHTIDGAAIAAGLFTPGDIPADIARRYDEELFHGATLQDLPDEPRFIINATNLASGALWRFSKPYMADWRVGTVRNPPVRLAHAVAASAAFPPILSPAVFDFSGFEWQTDEGNDLTSDEFRHHVVLTDGGVYDNLGLETAWKRCRTVLVSDAGGVLMEDPDPPRDWARQSIRVTKVVDAQVRDLRKRQIQAGYREGRRDGAYWSIRSDIAHFPVGDCMDWRHERTMELADTPTRLKAIPEDRQEALINWGYAACDAALRSWIDPALTRGSWPYPRGV